MNRLQKYRGSEILRLVSGVTGTQFFQPIYFSVPWKGLANMNY